MATIAAETSALKINASSIKSNIIGSNKKLAKLRVEKIKIIDTISKESIRKKAEKKIERPIKGITPIIGGAFSKLSGMVRPIKDGLLNVFGTLLLAFAIDKLPKIIETLTTAFETVKPVWTVATKTLRTIFDGIVSLKPFADQVYDFSKNTFTDISKRTQELTGIETEIDDDLKVFDGLFGEPQDIKEEEPQQEKETNIFSGVGSFFKNLLPGQKNQNKNKIKTQTSDKKTDLTQVAADYQAILKGYRRSSTAGSSRSTPTPSSPSSSPTSSSSSAPSTSGAGLNGILKFISKGEGGYNSMNQGTQGDRIVGSTGNARGKVGKNLTDMTLGEIMKRQSYLMNPNNPQISNYGLFAVGRYQIIPGTFPRAMRYAGLSPNDKFSPANQDKMGIGLIKGDAPAAWSYITGKSNDINGAINSLAAVWASIPTTSGRSAYGQGNAAGHSVAEVKNALISARNSYGRGSSNLNPIRQNRSISQSSRSSSGGNQTFIIPFGIEKIIPMFQGPSQSEVNSTTQRRHQRRANNLP